MLWSAKRLLLAALICLPGVASGETLERAGHVVGGQTGDLDTLALTNAMTEGVDLPRTHENLNVINSTVQSVVESEIARLEEYVNTFKPREEVITVTVYRQTVSGVYGPCRLWIDRGLTDDAAAGAFRQILAQSIAKLCSLVCNPVDQPSAKDGLWFHGMSSSIRACGWPAARASSKKVM